MYELPSGLRLLEATCAGGAYNLGLIYAIFDHRASTKRMLAFPAYEPSRYGDRQRPTTRSVLYGGPRFDPATGTPTITYKSRGLGDCRRLTRYAFPDGVPTAVELRAKIDCDGAHVIPTEWPLFDISRGGRVQEPPGFGRSRALCTVVARPKEVE